jgi:hypothetical protein
MELRQKSLARANKKGWPVWLPRSLYASLYTSDPIEAENQKSNETNYGGYSRVAIECFEKEWKIDYDEIGFPMRARASRNVDFGECTGSPGSQITHFGLGTKARGGGRLLFSGPIEPKIKVNPGLTPRLKLGVIKL